MEEYANGQIKRGCGKRQQGGVYAECGRSPFGRPVEYFLLCPPVLVDAGEMGLSPLGVQLHPVTVDGKEIWHVWDWVGSKFYPNVADFVEEVRLYGMSRRLSKGLDFKKLTPESRIFLLHANAHIENAQAFQRARIGGKALGLDWDTCPKGIHKPGETRMCAGLWWEDVNGMKVTVGRVGKREMPAFQYQAAAPIAHADHAVAVFASFPISRLAVVASEDGSHVKAHENASASSLPVEIVEE